MLHSGFVFVEDLRRKIKLWTRRNSQSGDAKSKSGVEELEGFPSGNNDAGSVSDEYRQGACTFDDLFVENV